MFGTTDSTYITSPAEPSDFRRIRLGDIDIRHEISLDRTSTSDRQINRARVRRVYSARLEGRKSSVTVAMYQKGTGEEEWQQDIARYWSIHHPNLIQICGTASSSVIHTAIFEDDLMPFRHLLELHQHSHVTTVYIYAYCSTDYEAARDYFTATFQRTLDGECTFWVRRPAGRLCVDPVPDGNTDHWILDVNVTSPPQGLKSLSDSNLAHSMLVDCLNLDQYHEICYWNLGQRRNVIFTSTTVNFGAVICCSLDKRLESSLEIASFAGRQPAIEVSAWRTTGGLRGCLMEDGWTRFTSGDVLDTEIKLGLSVLGTWSWLHQANHIFSRLHITSNFEDYVVVEDVYFTLTTSTITAPEGFLFLCPSSDFQIEPSSFRWPNCSAYWSIDPAGVNPLNAKDATDFGFPSVKRSAEIAGRYWDASVYAGLRQFHQAKGFDPDSLDVALHLGHPLYRLSSEVELPFVHVSEEDSGSEEDLNSTYTDCESSEETRSSVVQFPNEINAPFAHIVDGDPCHRELSQQDLQDFKLHRKLQISRIFIFPMNVQWIVARLILALWSLVLKNAGDYAGFRSKQPEALDADTASQSQDQDLAEFREDTKSSFIFIPHHQTNKYLPAIQRAVEDAEDWVANFVVATRQDMVSQLGGGVLGSFDDGFVVGIARSDSEVGRSKVYQHLIALIAQVGAGHDARFCALIQSLVRFMASLDPVWSLVKSAQLRIELLKISSALGFSDDRWLRDVLQKDEADIARLFGLVVSTEVYKQAVLRLKGESAQHGVDLIQDLLDKGLFEVAEDAGLVLKARRLLVRLSEASDTLPLSLFIRDVSCLGKDPAFWGGFGDIYRASYRGQHVALKRIRPICQKGSDWCKFRQRFCREALLWQRLQNPYVLPFIGIDAESFPTFLCMVSPWMQHGTILSHLAKNGTLSVGRRLFEIAQGLAYLHSQSIIHGDLRGSNIMVDDQWHACLADFGLSVFSNATLPTNSSKHGGSIRWMGPELLYPKSCGLENTQRSFANDVYSFACVCIELYTGKPPFSDIYHEMAVALQVIAKERPARPSDSDGREMMSDWLWPIVQHCWSHEVAERPCMDRVVELMMEANEEFRNHQ